MLPVGVDIFFIALGLSRIGWKGPNLCWLSLKSSAQGPYPASAGFSDRTGKSLSRPAFLRPVHGLHIGCDIPGFLDR